MLTAKNNDMDKINGLTLGADDYLTKPFNPLELAARVKTQLRRYTRYNTNEPAVNQQIYDFNGLMINNDNHKCTLYDQPLNLTQLNFQFFGIYVQNVAVSLHQKNFLKQYGKKNI